MSLDVFNQEVFASVKQEYVRYGDDRPKPEDLDVLTNTLLATRPVEPHHLTLATSLLIDTSQVSDAPELYITQTRETLEQIKSTVDPHTQQGMDFGIPARLRLAELGLWSTTSAELDDTEVYEQQLEALDEILRDYKPEDLHDPDNASTLIEATPLILGLRHKAVHDRHLWTGRLALLREEARETVGGGSVNWDIGLSRDSDTPIDSPEIRIQIKRARFKKAGGGKYRSNGIVPLAAISCGFENPIPILMDCVREASSSRIRSTGAGEIDSVTEAIDIKIAEETEKIQKLVEDK